MVPGPQHFFKLSQIKLMDTLIEAIIFNPERLISLFCSIKKPFLLKKLEKLKTKFYLCPNPNAIHIIK